MALVLYAHPFSSYCQKALIELYENGTNFIFRVVKDKQGFPELAALWPHMTFPVLLDGSTPVIEARVIIEYLMQHHPGPVQLVPETSILGRAACALHESFLRQLRHDPNVEVVTADQPSGSGACRDPSGVADAKAQLDVLLRVAGFGVAKSAP